jgi:uridine monophosphate synthetase
MAVKIGEDHPDFVIGFISRSRVCDDPKFLHFMPSVHLTDPNDEFDQVYTTPSRAIKEKGADIIIVGRGITRSNDPAKTSKIYQEEGYKAYKEMSSS